MDSDTHAPALGLNQIRKICCIGAGYVGGPTSIVIALKNPEIAVTVVDLNENLIAAWNSSTPPIFEPGLKQVLDEIRGRGEEYAPNNGTARKRKRVNDNLIFSTNVNQAIAEADLVFISVNTPTKADGQGRGFAADLASVEAATKQIAGVSRGYKIIVEKSTVPTGTADMIRNILYSNALECARFEVLSNPEFLAEGTAVSDLLNPDRVLIGSYDNASGRAAAESLASIYRMWVSEDRIIRINVFSSELAKLAANALLAQRISSINSLSAICEKTGADIKEVALSCGLDTRIGNRMLNSSVGFGGSCFRKDVLSLVYLAETLHLPEVAKYWKGVVEINEYQKRRFSDRIIWSLFNTVRGKKVAILGFSYKKDTGDARETPAAAIIINLRAEAANVHIFDPQVPDSRMKMELLASGLSPLALEAGVFVEHSPYDACHGADAVVVLTEWDMFKTSDASIKSERHRNNDLLASTTGIHRETWNTLAASTSAAGLSINRGGRQPLSTRERINWSEIAANMKKPRLVFDGRNILDSDELTRLGFRVEAIGK